jgi:fido (protein-threonine AMPylation protein)
MVIYSSKGSNNTVKLPFDTSIFDLKIQSDPKSDDIVEREGLRMYSIEAAVLKVSEAFFLTHPLEVRVVLSRIQDASNLLARLLDGGHSAIAGRLVGAFRSLGHVDIANDIRDAMKAADYDVRETDPFKQGPQPTISIELNAPISNRLRVIWEQNREVVVDVFQEAPGLPQSGKQYMNAVDDSYITDAYHSLSIEGYQVTPSLIEKVCLGNWDPEGSNEDRQNHDALSVRGYWQAYQQVRQVVDQILQGENATELVQKEFRKWYRELFQPMVTVGLAPASVLAGFRNSSVFIKGSRHVPPRNEIVVDAMTTLFELLQYETESSVRAVMGHWLIGYIHPFMDGNGRIARFFMNAMLASGGYPWTVVPSDKREIYMQALESASVDQDILPFAQFIADCMENPIRE